MFWFWFQQGIWLTRLPKSWKDFCTRSTWGTVWFWEVMITQDSSKVYRSTPTLSLPHRVDSCSCWLKQILGFQECRRLCLMRPTSCSVRTSSRNNWNKFYQNVPLHKESCAVPRSLRIWHFSQVWDWENTHTFIKKFVYLIQWNSTFSSSDHNKRSVLYFMWLRK